MTSVLYSAGLNYQASNPLRTEINRLQASIEEIRKALLASQTEVNSLKTRIGVLEKVQQTSAAAATVAGARTHQHPVASGHASGHASGSAQTDSNT